MDAYEFTAFIQEFNRLPPLHEIGRSYILLPGDDGYKGVDAKLKKRALDKTITTGHHAPEWFRRGFEKLKSLAPKGKNA